MSGSAALTREEILAVHAQGPEAVVALVTALCTRLARATANRQSRPGQAAEHRRDAAGARAEEPPPPHRAPPGRAAGPPRRHAHPAHDAGRGRVARAQCL